jgi:hypothetical protein
MNKTIKERIAVVLISFAAFLMRKKWNWDVKKQRRNEWKKRHNVICFILAKIRLNSKRTLI